MRSTKASTKVIVDITCLCRRKSPVRARFGNLSAAGVIRETLRNEIVAGQIQIGAQLRQEELAARFSVSRFPVREALRQLEVEGLVTSRHNRGAVVTRMSLTEVCDLMETLIALETRAVKLAIPNLSDADFAKLDKTLEAYDRASTPRQWARFDSQFHITILSASDNRFLTNMVQGISLKIERYLHSQFARADARAKSQLEHRAILAACRKGDANLAATIIENHILRAKKNLLASQRVYPDALSMVVSTV
jgi:DNA-binding GntR family transcriptional regulator